MKTISIIAFVSLISSTAFSQVPVYPIPMIDENVPEVEHLDTLPADHPERKVDPIDPNETPAPQGPIVGMVGQPSHFYAPVYHDLRLKDQDRHRFLGVGLDLGLPDGVALGIIYKPIPWVSGGLYGTFFLAPGIRGTLTLDPIVNSVVFPTMTLDLGHMFPGKIPGVENSPSIAYTYLNLQPGLAFGNHDGFQFFIRGGVSHFSGTVFDLEQGLNSSVEMDGVSVSDPNFSGWVPSGKIGFSTLIF